MGTNVSTSLCIKRTEDKVRHVSRGPFIGRNYELYSLMGLRGRGGPDPVFEARGMPSDTDSIVKFEHGVSPNGDIDPDYRFHSWLTAGELRAVAEAYESLPPAEPDEVPRIGPGFAATLGAMEALDRWCGETGGGYALLVFSFG